MTASRYKYDLVVSLVVYKPNLEHLQQTLQSLYSSNLYFKATIIDNSPTPLESSFLSNFSDLDYNFNQGNVGYGRAHNINITRYSQEARYFLVLNPDIYFDADLLPEMIRRMDADPYIGLSIPRVCHPSGQLQMINRRLPRPQDYVIGFLNTKFKTNFFATEKYKTYLLNDLDLKKPFSCPTISGCFMLFRADVLRDVGGFDKRYFLYLEDTDLSRRVARTHATVVFSDLTAFHHWTRGAYKNLKLFSLFVANLIRYFNKWGWMGDRERDRLNASAAYYPIAPIPVTSVLKTPEMSDSL